MKESIFNSVIKLGNNRLLIYNALSDRFLILRDASSFRGIRNLYESSTSFAKQLCEIGTFINDDKNEVSAVNDIIQRTDNDDTFFMLHINPTLDCNFRCWYCYEKHLKGSMMQSDTLECLKKYIFRTFEKFPKLKKFHLAFFGGEPLMGFASAVKPLIGTSSEKAAEKGIDFAISFTSNGYLITPEIIEYLKQFNCAFQITLDGGESAHNRVRYGKGGEESFRRIIDNIKRLAEADIRCVCRINYTSDNIESTESIYNAFDGKKRKNLEIDFQRVWQDRPAFEYETERDVEIDNFVRKQIRRYEESGFRTSYYKPQGGIWNSCYADKRNHVLVNFNGDVFNCTARDFNTENRSGFLNDVGKIEWKKEYMARRWNCKFIKKVCHKCRIAPLCGGGCRQQAMEHYDSEQCIYGYTEEDKDYIVLNRFENLFVK